MNVEGESMVVRGELGGRRPGLGTDDDKMCEYEGTRGSVGHDRADRDEAGRKRGNVEIHCVTCWHCGERKKAPPPRRDS